MTQPTPQPTRPPGSAQPAVSRSTGRRALWALVVAGLAGLVWLAATLLWRGPPVPPLPDLPDLDGQPASMAEHLRAADRAARQSPTTAAVVGRLGLAYHADTFADQARQCYARAQQLDPRDWRWKYYAALLAEEYGDNTAVIDHLRAVVALNPDFALAWLRLGQAEFKQDNVAAAETAYRQAIATDHPSPGDREPGDRSFAVAIYATYELSRVAVKRGQVETARAILQEITARRPDFGPAQRLLSQVETQLGNAAAADQARARAHALKPYVPPPDPLVDALARESHSSTFLMKQADLASRAGRTRWARELCRRAATVNDRDPDAQALLAEMLRQTGQLAEAIDQYRRALRLRPDDPLAHNNLGLILVATGRLTEAVDHFRAALRIDPALAETHNNLGMALARAGRVAEAIPQFEQALRVRPGYAAAHYNLGLARSETGQAAAALQHFTEATRLNPDYAEAHRALGIMLLHRGRATEAVNHLQQAFQLDPAPGAGRDQFALALQQTGRLAEAIAQYQLVLQTQPDALNALNNLAWLQAAAADPALRDGATAVRLAERAVALTGRRLPEYLDTLAAAYAEAGRWPEAVATGEQAQSLARAANQPSLAAEIAARLEQYRAGRAWREPGR